MTKIEYAADTHQLTTGCAKASPGCANCYAERMHRRLAGNPKTPMYHHPFNEVKCWPEQIAKISSLKVPRKHKGPYRVFINSMSDLFHKDVPASFILAAFAAFAARPDVIFQILTKRADRMAALINNWIKDRVTFREGITGRLPNNIWFGVTVCNQEEADVKIPLLLQVPAAVRFVSIEPMLADIDLISILRADHPQRLCCIAGCERCGYKPLHWVICGGETGPGARPMHPDWVRSLRDQCQAAGVPFFFKGWGEWTAEYSGVYRLIDVAIFNKADNGDKPILLRDLEPDRRANWDEYGPDDVRLYRVGKKAAGRVLNGRTWEEFPK